ncbi:hypothetical protein J2S00_000451 [Caldalkalibacillus uzonensis]|uniref:Uncharacterized protein n=1 Tax=Caldalkalibacillus uzonensis TaxID=353224 RepID=A0ABU0CP65_9BACI|nr:hypothetical protein [Caldalkalibacillus uzonensis]MDQ0337681.1 hypothetical protein [Caldalkalibacillus uzonensis]
MGSVSWNKEEGYALYWVMVASLFLFLILTHLLSTHVYQAQIIRAKELDVRAQNMVLSAVVIWTAEERQNQAGNSTARITERVIDLEDGTVTINQVTEIGEDVVLTVEAQVKDSDVKRRVRVTVDLGTGEITAWRNL